MSHETHWPPEALVVQRDAQVALILDEHGFTLGGCTDLVRLMLNMAYTRGARDAEQQRIGTEELTDLFGKVLPF